MHSFLEWRRRTTHTAVEEAREARGIPSHSLPAAHTAAVQGEDAKGTSSRSPLAEPTAAGGNRTPPRMTARAVVLLVLALAGLVGVLHRAYATVYSGPDFQVWWGAARLWLAGVDPYGPVGDATLGTGSGYAYPFPTVLLMLPLALLPLALAATVWALLSLATAAALPALVRDRPPWVFALVLAYFPLWASLEQAQWAPILLLFAFASLYLLQLERPLQAGIVLPLVLLKPHVGVALLAAVILYAAHSGAGRRWWQGLALGVLIWWGGSLLVAPAWPAAWLEQIRAYQAEDQNAIDALSLPGAFALALALGTLGIAWRRHDTAAVLCAALLAATLLVPTRSFYNHAVLMLPIALLATRAPRVAAVAVLLSWAALVPPLLGADAVFARTVCLALPLAALLLAAASAERWPNAGRLARADRVQ
jgi:hypothetical protein